ncbi:MAG: lipid A biosynthesis acyltransferase [Phycisphaerales bacterium]|nr:MAG: lipid A biosynthesis acyltransferase [Phycisphaerales bacterium]
MAQRDGLLAWLGYAAVRVAATALQSLPIDGVVNLARQVGGLWAASGRERGFIGRARRAAARILPFLRPRHRQRAIEHLRAAMPDASSDQIERIADRSMEHLAMFAVEVLCSPRLLNRWTWKRYVELVDYQDALRAMLEGNGAVLVTGHFGNWELLGHFFATLGFDIHAIMRPFDNRRLNEYLVRTRRTHGLRVVDKKGASAVAVEVLDRGGMLGFIADQDAGRKGIFVDFFGRPASSYKAIGLLAMEKQAPIVVGYARRLGNRFRYEIGVEQVIRPADWAPRDDPLRWITQEYTAAIERSVRRDPSQYLWIHRRWKSQPRIRQSEPRA